MRYEHTSEELYSRYRNGETLEYRSYNLSLLTARANNGNRVAKQYMALIEPNNKKWKLKPCQPHRVDSTDART